MSLTLEWLHRIQRWQEALWQCCYRPVGSVTFESFTTFQHLSAEEAGRGPFAPLPPGSAWGKRWEYGWFRGQAILPAEAAGRRVALRAAQGVESLVWVNGLVAGSFGWGHNEITPPAPPSPVSALTS